MWLTFKCRYFEQLQTDSMKPTEGNARHSKFIINLDTISHKNAVHLFRVP